MTTNALSAASLAIYIILLQPTLYVLFRHGWPGFLGWFYLQLFCILRVIGNGLSISTPLDPTPLAGSTASSDKATLIVNNIGLSPLLLATAGILHEARRARYAPVGAGAASGATWKSTREWQLVFHYHFLVSGALALIIAGVVILDGGAGSSLSELNTASSLVKAGSAIVLVCWALLVLWAGVSLFAPGGDAGLAALDYRAGSKLLYAVIIILPLIALRLIYGVTSLLLIVTGNATSGFETSLAAKVILGTVPEMVLVIVLIAAGIMTQNIVGAFWKKREVRREYSMAAKATTEA